MTTFDEEIRDVLGHWPVGSGYYATSVGTGEAYDMAAAILAMPEMQAIKEALLRLTIYAKDLQGLEIGETLHWYLPDGSEDVNRHVLEWVLS